MGRLDNVNCIGEPPLNHDVHQIFGKFAEKKKALTITCFGCEIATVNSGLGRHIYYLKLNQIIKAGKLTLVTELLTNLIILVVKLSIALFLLRIGGLRKWLRYSLFATIALLVTSTSVFVVVLFVQCRPLAAVWDPRLKAKADCLPKYALPDVSYCMGGRFVKSATASDANSRLKAISVFTDFLFAVLPFQIVWDLNMNRKTKISVLVLLCMASLSVQSSVICVSILVASVHGVYFHANNLANDRVN